jgi:hypothetical protein
MDHLGEMVKALIGKQDGVKNLVKTWEGKQEEVEITNSMVQNIL